MSSPPLEKTPTRTADERRALLAAGLALAVLASAGAWVAVARPLEARPLYATRFHGFHTGFPVDVALADFDGDARLDIAAADAVTNSVFVRLGDGEGDFVSTLQLPLPGRGAAIVAGNLDSDSFPDIAVTSDAPNLSIFRGQGDGTSSEASRPDAAGSSGRQLPGQ